jgi:AraC-like DNA-binding protein
MVPNSGWERGLSIYAPLVGLIWRVLESYGLDPRAVIDESHYRPGDESATDRRVSFEYYDAVQKKAAELIGDPAIGLKSAQFLHPSHLGALGYAWLASSSLRTALLRSERYTRMFNEHVEARVVVLPDRIRVSYRPLRRASRPDEIADAQLAGLLTLCRVNFGSDLAPIEVTMRRAEPADPSLWHEFFGVAVKFGQPENSLSISAADADRPLTGANRELLAVHEEVIRRHLAHLDSASVLERVRMAIVEELPSGRVTEEQVAQALHMSRRTLHRRLREHSTTFRGLLAEVRQELARRYIRDAHYSVTEVAFSLGYADTSAFSRAFRGWFGLSPTEARQRARAAH